MHICMGLVGPKSENVKKTTGFLMFFEGVKREQEHAKNANNLLSKVVFGRKRRPEE